MHACIQNFDSHGSVEGGITIEPAKTCPVLDDPKVDLTRAQSGGGYTSDGLSDYLIDKFKLRTHELAESAEPALR